MNTFPRARPAPRALLFLATFNTREREAIAADAALCAAIRSAVPADWPSLLAAHRSRQRSACAARTSDRPPDASGMRRQALHDLKTEARAYAELTDGRRDELFRSAARLAKYVTNEVLTEAELRAALEKAADENGTLRRHGDRFVEDTITRALAMGENDELPALARRFRRQGAN